MENEIEVSAIEKSRSTAWLIRCSPEQKDFFQRSAAESGKNAADFVISALENYKIKVNLNENSKIQKELQESEHLIERLTSLIRSKILILSEKEIQLQTSIEELNIERSSLQQDFAQKEIIIKDGFEEAIEKLSENFQQQNHELEIKHEKQMKLSNENYLILEKKFEELEIKLRQKENESQIYRKQVSDSMKLYESIEERNSELKKLLSKLEEENTLLKQQLEKANQLEKQQSDRAIQLEKRLYELDHKMQIMAVTHEQELKRLQLEQELKIKIKEQEVENKYRNS